MSTHKRIGPNVNLAVSTHRRTAPRIYSQQSYGKGQSAAVSPMRHRHQNMLVGVEHANPVSSSILLWCSLPSYPHRHPQNAVKLWRRLKQGSAPSSRSTSSPTSFSSRCSPLYNLSTFGLYFPRSADIVCKKDFLIQINVACFAEGRIQYPIKEGAGRTLNLQCSYESSGSATRSDQITPFVS
jgi:hypothetical protein